MEEFSAHNNEPTQQLLTKMTIHDPLTINLTKQTRSLLTKIPPESVYTTVLTQASTVAALLDTLSRLLFVPALTLPVATAFRPLLLDLCARWLEDEENKEDKLVALCLLLEPHEELYPVLSAFLRKKFDENGPLAFLMTCESIESIEASRLHRLLLAYYRILQANRPLPHDLYWPLSALSKLFHAPHPDTGVRLVSIRCYALQCGMSEAQREKLEKEVLGEFCGVDCQIDYGEDIDGSPKVVDGWLLPVLEIQRITDARNALITEPQDFYDFQEGEYSPSLTPSDLSPLIANIHGVLFLRSLGPPETTISLISTPTAVASLRSLATRLSLRVPTLLTSPPSAGKSLLISHLAALLYPGAQNHIITIHLADTSLDPRSLLGSYISSPTQPGTFEWKDGVVVRAMKEGKWLVFEDIDRGSNEVLGIIKPLAESLDLGKWIGGCATLEVPSRGRVEASEGFALFATRSLAPSRTGKFPAPVFFGAHKFHEVVIPSPTPEELRMILDSRFPRLAGNAVQALIRLWEAVRALGSAASSRDVGLRELEKFCARVDNLLPSSHQPMDISDTTTTTTTTFDDSISLTSIFPNPVLREDMYLEARDVFFGAGGLTASARLHVERIAATVAEHLGLEPERSEWVLQGRTPEFDIEKDVNGRATAVRIGRTRLPARSSKVEIVLPATRPFAMHRPAVLLLSRIATAVSLGEPILLTGETGTGKTSIITHLASLLRRPLISLNLSHQTESSDLLGGFKPVDARVPGSALQERFLELFGGTFSRRKNAKFEESVRKAVGEGKWKRAVGLWKESARLAKDRIVAKQNEEPTVDPSMDVDPDTPRKRRKLESTLNISEASWSTFERDVDEFNVQHVQGKGKFAFGFVEGPLVKALRSGDWILLDEINLASPETLECISGLLHGPTASVILTEQGALEPVPRHPDFRLFACMNPATDVGKKDLPPNIRSRFTEVDVAPPDADRETLLGIVTQYIGPSAVSDKAAIMDVAEFYSAVKRLAEERQIADGSNHRPHYSMRTLARALTFAADMASTYSLRRALWEGCLMAFTMVLDAPSSQAVTALAQKHLLANVRNLRSLLSKEPACPQSRPAEEFFKLGPFYLERGPLPEDIVNDYIMTPSVETKLVDLARIIVTGRFPVLIEGPTSSGKTSSVEYLARRTGHRFIRINNHEHTDIQEYLGSYVSDPTTGKLEFRDGLLVHALRNGDWIVLDELNLAPSDVLEALNRLLDDNRELVVPETQEVIRPHPHFMLFATQNPPGLYAGRKVLSRAFRNRFLEVHFEDVPQAELETILCQRCRIAPSYGQRIVSVFRELQKRRQSGRVFESKHGFATLRDLFRWAGRDAVGYQELAENGYMLLAERARREDDKQVVKDVIESIMKVHIDERAIYDKHLEADFTTYLGFPFSPSSSSLVWTAAMRRLFILVGRALRFNEPVLLVGETGSGKTSVCQVYADSVRKRLHSLNCHQNTETADLIGGLRPVRNRAALESEVLQDAVTALEAVGFTDIVVDPHHLLAAIDASLRSDGLLHTRSQLENARRGLVRLNSIFEWHDGPLVEAMRCGEVFLLDEISLADDSVLERLNSVLEPARTVVLAERGGDDVENTALRAADGFQLVATMNPGGDYGKKELSPALRNRFTEIWVPPVDVRSDLKLIVDGLWLYESFKQYTPLLLDFVEWLCTRVADRSLLSLRDILVGQPQLVNAQGLKFLQAWVTFSNTYHFTDDNNMPLNEIFHHAAHMTFIDGLGSLPQLAAYSSEGIQCVRTDALVKLQELAPLPHSDEPFTFVPAFDPTKFIQLGSFAIPKGPAVPTVLHAFNLQAPTTLDNAMRVVRACQVDKPILLEGSPGVGKTSLVTALANISGHRLCRINLSDQTDLIDLFGSDLPVDGGGPGDFAWRDAEFLTALQEGHWVLLDEMNLAPQAVLEGLNAILDHRGTVFIPELGRSFTRHPSFRIFAAQNPLQQGGGRKGLPRSFVNRFTKVYVEELSANDLMLVCRHLFPELDVDVLRAMIDYNARLNEATGSRKTFARLGSPWEFNLRDVIRWGALLRTSVPRKHPMEYLRSTYLHRFRTPVDRDHARLLFDKIFSVSSHNLDRVPSVSLSSTFLQIGHFNLLRSNPTPSPRPGRILQMHQSALESAGHCVTQSWLVIITGSHSSGKTGLVRVLANLTGNHLHEISMNNATDAMDILGSFEQVDNRSRVIEVAQQVLSLVDEVFRAGCKMDHTENYRALQQAIKLDLSSRPISNILLSAANLLLEVGDLIGHRRSESDRLQARIHHLVASSETMGRFEWVDGPLVRALKQGYWLLLDGANLCNPSVLDRLNSLCEPGGVLTLSERGHVDGDLLTIKPHPNFRLFMSVDPQFGELSRAMRNRGLEIALFNDSSLEDQKRIQDHSRLPLVVTIPNADCTFFSADYDSVRRGLTQPTLQPPFSKSHWPSGFIPNLDSASSALLTFAPFLCGSSDDIGALLHFLSRTISPALLPYFNRFMLSLKTDESVFMNQIRDLLRSLAEHQDIPLLTRVRGEWGRSRRSPADFVLAQPMDIYLKCSPCPECETLGNNPSAHRMIIEVLNLLVSLISDKAESQALDTSRRVSTGKSFIEEINRPHKALKAIELVLNTIAATAISVLRHLGDTICSEKHMDLNLAVKMLEYGGLLKGIVANSIFDYSVAQATSEWITEALRGCSLHFTSLADSIQGLKDAVALSCGFGITRMWSTLLIQTTPCAASTLSSLDSVASQDSRLPDIRGFRMQAFQLIALRTLPASPTDDEQKALNELGKQMEMLIDDHTAATSPSYADDDGSSLVAELCILIKLEAIDDLCITKAPIQAIRQIIKIACETPHISLRRLAPYQHLLWAIDAKRTRVPIIAQCQTQWLNAIWSLGAPNSDAAGPSILLSPVCLCNSVQKCDWKGNSLSSLTEYESRIRRHVQLVLIQCGSTVSRADQLPALLIQAMLMLSACFQDPFGNKSEHSVSNMDNDISMRSPSSVVEALEYLQKSNNVHFLRAVKHFLHPAIQCFADQSRSRVRDTSNLGRCWVAISRLMIDLFVPNIPIDPAAAHRCASEFWRQEESTLCVQIQLQRRYETLTTGNSSNAVILYLNTRLKEVRERLSQLAMVPLLGRQSIPQLHAFWSEIFQFQTQVISPSKIDSLLDLFDTGNTSAVMREQVIQESIAGFCQRMESTYPEFADIRNPLQLALLYLRLGLRLIAHSFSVKIASTGSWSDISTALVAFPLVRSTAIILTPSAYSGTSSVTPFQHVLLNTAAITVERSLGVDVVTHINDLETLYEQAFRLWSIDRAKDDQKNLESQSLYRRKSLDHDAANEHEVEEREFLELFPNFEDVIDREDRSHSLFGRQDSGYVNLPQIQLLVDLHHMLWSNPKGTSSQASQKFQTIRTAALESLLELHPTSLPEALDNESLVFQFDLLHGRLCELQRHGTDKNLYSFYNDANVLEVKKATVIVESLKLRLETLIHEWPDQMVLQHLKSRCDGVLGLDLHSSVAQVLSALEQLLLQTQDWEIYANRENTLKNHQQSLTALIVDWRRLELSCWQVLLQSQARMFAERTSESWFRLYDICVRGPLAATDEESREGSGALVQYLDQFKHLLDDFVRSSSLGQYLPRMRLLQTFEAYIGSLARSKHGEPSVTLHRVQHLLHTTLRYYKLFSPHIMGSLSDRRAALEKEIQGFIKLASWKDVNVHALKQSAQRTHHNLYKIIRKFRDVMRQPITEFLQPVLAEMSENMCTGNDSLSTNTRASMSIEQPTFPTHDTNSAPHLDNLGRTYLIFNSTIANRIEKSLDLHSALPLDNLTTEIIVAAKGLASESVPKDLSDSRRQKLQKALLVRKRKAWSDLLKELKRNGLSSNVKADVLRRQSDSLWIKEQPILPITLISTVKVDLYFDRLHASLPSLRTSLSDHHSDVTTRELQRGIMFLESGFTYALEARSRLAGSLGAYTEFRKLASRLQTLATASNTVAFDVPLHGAICRIKNVACKLTNALEEVVRAVKTFYDLQSSSDIASRLMETVQTTASACNTSRDRLAQLTLDVGDHSSSVLLDSEYAMILEARQQLMHTSTSLNHWSNEEPVLQYVFQPVQTWLDTQDFSLPSPIIPKPMPSLTGEANSIIDALLVNIQCILPRCPVYDDNTSPTNNDNYIRDGSRFLGDLADMLNIGGVLHRLLILFPHLAIIPHDELQRNLQRFLPFLERYIALAEEQLVALTQWTQTLFKLLFVLCSIMHKIAKEGFCQPPETDESNSGGDTAEATGGVGLGEGSGTENVSKEIEDESQVEGINKDEDDTNGPPENAEDGDDNTIEMSEDFGGALDDVPENGSQDDGDSDEESQGEADEQLGDLDASDPSAVDEKLWGDEQGPEEDREIEKTAEDRSGKGADSEVVSKEDKIVESKESKVKEGEEDSDSEPQEDIDDDGTVPEELEDQDGGEDPEANGAPMDDQIQDANTLDLPDDMDLGLGDDTLDPEDADKDNSSSIGDLDDLPDASDDPGIDVAPPSSPEPIDDESCGGQAQETGGDAPIEDHPEESAVAQPDVSAGEGNQTQEEPEYPNDTETASAGQVDNGSGGTKGKSTSEAQVQAESSNTNPSEGELIQQPLADITTEDSIGTGPQQGSGPLQLAPELSNNPLRSLGDALKEIRQRFDEILDGQDRNDAFHERAGDPPEMSQVEYLRPDDADRDMQALGPAGEEQVAKLNELRLVDDDAQMLDSTIPMDVDSAPVAEAYDKPLQTSSFEADLINQALMDDVDGAVTQSDVRNVVYEDVDPFFGPPGTKSDVEMEDIEEDNVEDIEKELRHWQADGQPDAGTERLWRLYESLTHDLAYALCEQLRLILEPTLATRLKGDYRTGKRLNMKKIIPYIASDYTKDKIWLRRTRPSQREYQVLIALDDSRSMAESHSVHLAYETLALVSKALSRLEVGDIAIARFGEGVEVLHGFDEGPFTDQAGTKVMNAFRFNQKATNVLSLVDTSLKMLEHARERRSMISSSSTDLWQLEIIISDGICQDHDRLRTVLRKAEEQRVMIVFIVIDSLHSAAAAAAGTAATASSSVQSSILAMNQVAYKNVDGRMELQMERYMDSFPFEYYVVLRNVEALPEVLTGTLKQFFERISEE